MSVAHASGNKRLLVVVGSLCAEGTPVLTLDLCRRWKTMGVESTVITLAARPTDLEPEFARNAIPVRSMDLPDSGRSRYARMVAYVASTCRELRPHALLSMPLGWHAFMAAGARLAGVRTVAAHVGNYPANRSGLAWRKFRTLVQLGRPLTTKLICCSSYVQRGVIEHFGVRPSETEVIYNGSDLDEIAARASTSRAKDDVSRRLVVGMVARFEVHKDQPTLIRAAKLLSVKGLPIEVLLIGDGSRRDEYQKLIAELGLSQTVHLMGVRRDVPELLGTLDVFAFAVKPDEGQGVALVEAMAAGVPIVASDVGACREVLDGGAAGVLVPPGDPDALAAALETLSTERDAWRKRTERARCKAWSAFSIDAMALSYARCLKLLEPAQ